MRALAVTAAALVLMLASLPFLSFGTDEDVVAVWVTGLVVLALGASVAPVLRFVDLDEDTEDDDQDDGDPTEEDQDQ